MICITASVFLLISVFLFYAVYSSCASESSEYSIFDRWEDLIGALTTTTALVPIPLTVLVTAIVFQRG
jgi:hypothetical protein